MPPAFSFQRRMFRGCHFDFAFQSINQSSSASLEEKGHEPDLNALQAELGVMKEENRSLAETIDKLMDQMGSLKKENEKLTQVVKGQ